MTLSSLLCVLCVSLCLYGATVYAEFDDGEVFMVVRRIHELFDDKNGGLGVVKIFMLGTGSYFDIVIEELAEQSIGNYTKEQYSKHPAKYCEAIINYLSKQKETCFVFALNEDLNAGACEIEFTNSTCIVIQLNAAHSELSYSKNDNNSAAFTAVYTSPAGFIKYTDGVDGFNDSVHALLDIALLDFHMNLRHPGMATRHFTIPGIKAIAQKSYDLFTHRHEFNTVGQLTFFIVIVSVAIIIGNVTTVVDVLFNFRTCPVKSDTGDAIVPRRIIEEPKTSSQGTADASFASTPASKPNK